MNPFRYAVLPVVVLIAVSIAVWQLTLRDRSTQPQGLDTDIVAQVGDRQITATEVNDHMLLRSGGSPGYFQSEDRVQALLEEMIDRESQFQQALEAGYADDPEVMEMFRRVVLRRFREDHLDTLLAAASVTDDEVRAAYDARIEEFTTPAMSRIALIQLNYPGGSADTAAVDQLASQVRQQALALGPDVRGFGPLAARYSEHQSSRYRGGDMGWFTLQDSGEVRGALDNEMLLEAVASLREDGAVSEPVITQAGVTLLKRIDYKPRAVQAYDEVSPGIRQELLADRRQALERDWIEAQRANVPVEIDSAELNRLLPAVDVTAQKERLKPPELPNG